MIISEIPQTKIKFCSILYCHTLRNLVNNAGYQKTFRLLSANERTILR